MIYPLVEKEKETLSEFIKAIEELFPDEQIIINLHEKGRYSEQPIKDLFTIDHFNREILLNILKMAQSNNEQLTKDWKNDKIGGKCGSAK